MSRKRYSVVFLAGHGIGAEVTAQASRLAAAAAQMHGFVLDDEHVPFGSAAFVRYGNPFPPSSRRAVASASAVLVPADDEGAVEALQPELDLRAVIVRVRVDAKSQVTLIAPLDEAGAAWTVERAFEIAHHSRARVTLVRADDDVRRLAATAALEADGIQFERMGLGDAVRRLVESPGTLDVIALPARGHRHGRRGRRLHVDDPHRGVGPGRPAGARRVRADARRRHRHRRPGRRRPAVDAAGRGAHARRGARRARRSRDARGCRRTRRRPSSRARDVGDRVLEELPHGLRFEFGGAVA